MRRDPPSSDEEEPPRSSSNSSTAWKWPWIVMLLGLFAFGLPWIGGAIIVRYWIEQDYNAVLVGLDTTTARKVTMVGHMSFGAICLVLGPFQFLPVIRSKWPRFHRYMGRMYVASAVLCSLLGFIFIFLKGFVLVGGINMGIAFFAAGLAFGISAGLTAYYARHQCWTEHRNWSIRAYSQILSPMLYRYFYLILGGLQLYPADTELICDERDVCQPFTNTFDAIHAWAYFLVPLGFAELICRSLPEINSDRTKEDGISSPPAIAVSKEDEVLETGGLLPPDKPSLSDEDQAEFNFRRINLLGVSGAIFAVAATGLIYGTSITGVNTVST